MWATAVRSLTLQRERSVPFGKYWRSSPSHGLLSETIIASTQVSGKADRAPSALKSLSNEAVRSFFCAYFLAAKVRYQYMVDDSLSSEQRDLIRHSSLSD